MTELRRPPPRSRALNRAEYRVRAHAVWAVVTFACMVVGSYLVPMAPMLGTLSGAMAALVLAEWATVWLLGPRP